MLSASARQVPRFRPVSRPRDVYHRPDEHNSPTSAWLFSWLPSLERPWNGPSGSFDDRHRRCTLLENLRQFDGHFSHALGPLRGKAVLFAEITSQVEQFATLIGVVVDQFPVAATQPARGLQTGAFGMAGRKWSPEVREMPHERPIKMGVGLAAEEPTKVEAVGVRHASMGSLQERRKPAESNLRRRGPSATASPGSIRAIVGNQPRIISGVAAADAEV